MNLLSEARLHFGISSFRGDQESIINASLTNRDILVVQGTGFGKSLCFQLPALIRAGITLVISPLVALMDDQVSHLLEKGIWATAIHRNLDQDEIQHRLDLLHLHQYDLLYLSPEKLASQKFLRDLSVLPISHVVVDEAHCISEWGHQFRPAYRNIKSIRRLFKKELSISAFTATAPTWVKQDISDCLEMKDTLVFSGSIFRSNLSVSCQYCELEIDKWLYLVQLLATFIQSTKEDGGAAIIYVITRSDAEQLSEKICQLWENQSPAFAAAYHAGLDAHRRHTLQQAFQNGKIRCMVATNAFGMGVDKSNVRLVVLFGAPASPESLLQQIGRAGRDGEPANSVILFSRHDFLVHQQLQSNSTGTVGELLQHRLQTVAQIITSPRCRWKILAEYYDEPLGSCNNCDTCKQSTDIIPVRNRPEEKMQPLAWFQDRQRTAYQLLTTYFPEASTVCVPGLGRGVIHETNDRH